MSLALTVVSDFGPYRRGDQITDPAKIKEVLDSEQSPRVVKMQLPDKPSFKPADPAPQAS